MAKKLVGRVSPEERDEVRELFQRKTALGELFLALGKMDAETLAKSPLYEKAVRDMGGVSVRFQQWWEGMARKYGWEGKDGGNWSIDFDSCDIYLE
ncbi:MAG: CXXX repeat peptide modification system protein [Deltaproteobacteria bacterium]|nr:CXXX repeat peptide modification system protein [Deltaproteobacteria bacterium]